MADRSGMDVETVARTVAFAASVFLVFAGVYFAWQTEGTDRWVTLLTFVGCGIACALAAVGIGDEMPPPVH